jgi:hypothetical protein
MTWKPFWWSPEEAATLWLWAHKDGDAMKIARKAFSET